MAKIQNNGLVRKEVYLTPIDIEKLTQQATTEKRPLKKHLEFLLSKQANKVK